MNIGFDLDGTIINTESMLAEELKKEGYILNIEDHCSYFLEEQGIPEDIVKLCVRRTLERTDIPLYPYAREALNFIGRLCDEVYIITHRPMDLFETTETMLDSFSFTFLPILHLLDSFGHSTPEVIPNKAKIINMFDIDIFVEDRADTVLDIYNKTDCYSVILDRPWNQDLENNDRIYRVKSWAQAEVYILSRMLNDIHRGYRRILDA